MNSTIATSDGREIVTDLVRIITANRDYLSEIDGAIGDGDHGINMAKGFTLCGQAIQEQELTLTQAFDQLAETLLEGIGGSMGPLYGSLFMGMAERIATEPILNAEIFAQMLRAGLTRLQTISAAKVGDKCIMDSLVPAVEAFESAQQSGATFSCSLAKMKEAATLGRDSTRPLVAKVGRASRLGERSQGVLDAGAISCCLLICQLADSVEQRLVNG